MSIIKPFKTLPEMFDNITKEFSNIERPVYLRKIKGKYQGIRYSEYRSFVKNFMMGLMSIGVKAGDSVAILSENRTEWVISDMAIICLGGINVPVYPSLTAKQIEYIFNDADVQYVIVSNQLQLNKITKILSEVPGLKKIIMMNEKFDALEKTLKFSDVLTAGESFEINNPGLFDNYIKERKPEDVCTIIYTSGTTGNPKGVMLTNKNFVSQVHSLTQHIDFNSNDTLLSFLPLCHVFERSGTYFSFANGCSTAFAENINTVAENMVEVKPTIIITVPRLFERIHSKIIKTIENSSPAKKKIFRWALKIGLKYANAKKDKVMPLGLKTKFRFADKLVFSKLRAKTGGRIRFFISGGAGLPRQLGEFFEAIGILIIEGYGLTETSPTITANKIHEYKFGSVGKPLNNVEVKLAEDGEILTRGPCVMKGYFRDEESTKNSIDSDGWFHTGDIGKIDNAGYIYLTDRKKHLFVSSGGKNIAPQPIENLFLSSSFIDQFVLIGDRRHFLSALIVPDFDAIREYADAHKIDYNEIADLANHKEIYKLFEQDIGIIQKDLANYERVRKFVLLDKPLTLEEGEITPTQKIKRNVIEEKYRSLIESMYK